MHRTSGARGGRGGRGERNAVAHHLMHRTSGARGGQRGKGRAENVAHHLMHRTSGARGGQRGKGRAERGSPPSDAPHERSSWGSVVSQETSRTSCDWNTARSFPFYTSHHTQYHAPSNLAPNAIEPVACFPLVIGHSSFDILRFRQLVVKLVWYCGSPNGGSRYLETEDSHLTSIVCRATEFRGVATEFRDLGARKPCARYSGSPEKWMNRPKSGRFQERDRAAHSLLRDNGVECT